MKDIRWKESGASKKIVSYVNRGKEFSVVTEGNLARVLTNTFGSSAVGITTEKLKLIIGIVYALAAMGIIIYAIGKGYEIEGEAVTPDGTKYILKFKPKKKEVETNP